MSFQVLASFGLYFSTNIWLSICMMFLVGITSGGRIGVGTIYTSDFLPEKYHTTAMTLINTADGSTMIYVAIYYYFDPNWKPMYWWGSSGYHRSGQHHCLHTWKSKVSIHPQKVWWVKRDSVKYGIVQWKQALIILVWYWSSKFQENGCWCFAFHWDAHVNEGGSWERVCYSSQRHHQGSMPNPSPPLKLHRPDGVSIHNWFLLLFDKFPDEQG